MTRASITISYTTPLDTGIKTYTFASRDDRDRFIKGLPEGFIIRSMHDDRPDKVSEALEGAINMMRKLDERAKANEKPAPKGLAKLIGRK